MNQRITVAGVSRRYRVVGYGSLGLLVEASGVEPFWARTTTEARTVLRAAYETRAGLR